MSEIWLHHWLITLKLYMKNPSPTSVIDELIEAMERNLRKLPEGIYTAEEIIVWLKRQKQYYK